MNQVSDRFDIPLGGPSPRPSPRRTINNPVVSSDRFDIAIEERRRPSISTQNFVPKPDSRFEGIETSEIDKTRYAHHRRPEYKADDRFGIIEVQGPEEKRRERQGPSDRFSNIVSEMQDPRRMARSGGPPRQEQPLPTKISIRNTFVDLIDHALVQSKSIAPVPVPVAKGGAGTGDEKPQTKKQTTQSNKKKKHTGNLDDLDDDRPVNNMAILEKYAEEEVDEEDLNSKEDTGEEVLTGKAAKQQRKRERLIAEGRGYVYDQKY